jgi:hypothetical protein
MLDETGERDWKHVRHTDSTVANGLKAGVDLETIIVQLVWEKERAYQRIVDLSQIVPRKFTTPNGSEIVWHCPDDLIPSARLEAAHTSVSAQSSPLQNIR